MHRPLRSFALALVFVSSACSSSIGGGNSDVPAARRAPAAGPGNYIKHVIVIVQENRSFDNLFYCFPGTECPATAPMADPTNLAHVTRVKLHSATFTSGDIDHDWATAMKNWDNGKMDGFARSTFGALGGGGPIGDFAYEYIDRKDVKPYWDMALQYTLLDRMFPDMFGPSFTAHLSLIAGTTAISNQWAEIDLPVFTPWSCDSVEGGRSNPTVLVQRVAVGARGYLVPHYNQPVNPCFTQFDTMADVLDAKNVS